MVFLTPFTPTGEELKFTSADVRFMVDAPCPLAVPSCLEPVEERGKTPGFSVGYLGDARMEKNFPAVAALVSCCKNDYEFIIQASPPISGYEGNIGEIAGRLKAMSEQRSDLIVLDRPLSRKDYFNYMNMSSLLLCPYKPGAY